MMGDVVTTAAHALPGYLAGFACGYLFRNYLGGEVVIARLKRALHRAHDRINGYALMLIIVSLSFFISAGALVWTVHENTQLVACVQDYADKRDAATRPRNAAVERRDQAVDRAIRAAAEIALEKNPTAEHVEKVRAAFANYLEVSAELQQARKDNPFPDPPSSLCEDS